MRQSVIDGLRAFARADESPEEREIAKLKLAEAGVPIDPPRPPAPPSAAPAPFHDNGTGGGLAWTATSNGGATWYTIRVDVS